jgi:outer membrane protein OmpA-like peptidoglycan-associated protein
MLHLKLTAKLIAIQVLLLTGFVQIANSNAAVYYKTIVNSNADEIKADNALTLREAIALINGELKFESLSTAERSQVTPATGNSSIGFNLPSGKTQIALTTELPAIVQPGTLVDGTTQSGYDANKSATQEIAIAIPIVELTPARNMEVLRGLTIVADRVTVRGLSIHGFTASHRSTAMTLPADIFISHRTPPPNAQKQNPPANFAPYYPDDVPPKNVVIENNWLGISPSRPTDRQSAFGVSVFQGEGTVIRRNRIEFHDGSAIITGVSATNSDISENIIVNNGLAGMPDGIRLEGDIDRTRIHGNLMCGNDGAGVYLFKPQGSVKITDNQIRYNGRRLRRSAIYLTGSGHEVTNNQITHQAGAGVVVGAYPKSDRNVITNNRFDALEGMSIDLNTQENTYAQAWQTGDGPNPKRKGDYRHLETGNQAINAPEFDRDTFTNTEAITGTAEPNSTIAFYSVQSNAESDHGPLTEPIGTTTADASGRFSVAMSSLTAKLVDGDRVSAIATDPARGTSEPAINAVIGSWSNITKPTAKPAAIPPCTTPPPVLIPIPTPTDPIVPVKLQAPTRIHFALDQDFISPASAKILDRIAKILIASPGISLDLEGHTDPRANDDYNQNLGLRRATRARTYLLKRGISASRMSIRSFGETKRIANGNSKTDYARDRRVDIIYRDSNGLELTVEESDLQLE